MYFHNIAVYFLIIKLCGGKYELTKQSDFSYWYNRKASLLFSAVTTINIFIESLTYYKDDSMALGE